MGSYNNYNKQPVVDAGLGLVIRLNILMSKADWEALDGNFDKWNFILDRIYCNLRYANELKLVYRDLKDGAKPKPDTPIIEVSLSSADTRIYDIINEKLKKIKLAEKIAIRRRKLGLYNRLHEMHYKTLMLKDMWLRKEMQDLKLYMKEVEFNPATAMFGGGR